MVQDNRAAPLKKAGKIPGSMAFKEFVREAVMILVPSPAMAADDLEAARIQGPSALKKGRCVDPGWPSIQPEPESETSDDEEEEVSSERGQRPSQRQAPEKTGGGGHAKKPAGRPARAPTPGPSGGNSAGKTRWQRLHEGRCGPGTVSSKTGVELEGFRGHGQQ